MASKALAPAYDLNDNKCFKSLRTRGISSSSKDYKVQLFIVGICLLGVIIGVGLAALALRAYALGKTKRAERQGHNDSGLTNEEQPLLRPAVQPLQVPSKPGAGGNPACTNATDSTDSLASTLVQNLDQLKLEVRLMRLHAGASGSKLVCTLQIESLKPGVEAPPYAALSYVWADMPGKKIMMVDGVQLTITMNLALALSHLRYEDCHRLLWVDAVCINQEDEIERGHQVTLMGTVYARASEVLIWLGPESHDSAQALRDLEMLSQDKHFSELDFFGSTTVDADSRKCWVPATVERIDPIENLLNRAYWSRVWVVQEIARAQKATVLCGRSSVSWETCVKVRDNWPRHSRKCCNTECGIMDPRTRRTMNWLNSSWRRYQDADGDLLSRLSLTRGLKATDPRDKIFGALGLVRDSTCFLDPDYKSEHPVVFRDWTCKIIETTGRLEVFLYTQYSGEDAEENIPSWVPDWTKYEASVRFQTERLEHHKHISRSFNADGGFDLSHSFLRLGDRLRLAGHCVDTVAYVGDALTYNREPRLSDDQNQVAAIKKWNAVLESWSRVRDKAGLADSRYPGGGTYDAAYWRTLLSDHITEVGTYLGDRVSSTADEPRYEAWRRWFEILVQRPDEAMTAFYKDSLADNRDLDRFDWTIMNMNYNRKLFSTGSGRIGMGPAEVKPGDLIVILCGGKTPFVVRPSARDVASKSFHVIGYAYLHGVMDGEAAPSAMQWANYWLS